MPADLPVSFEQKAKQGGNPAAGGYPYQLSASDLDKNFVFAALDVDDSLIEPTTGTGGHKARKLKIPAVPEGDKLHVLGAVGGKLKWVETESC
jgi:hypothetical protein